MQKGDLIKNLPTNDSDPTPTEVEILKTLFPEKSMSFNIKDILLVGSLFIIFSLSPVDSLLKKLFPFTENASYLLVLIKAVIVMILYWIISTFIILKSRNI